MGAAGEHQALAGLQFHTRARHGDNGFAVRLLRPAGLASYEHLFDQTAAARLVGP